MREKACVCWCLCLDTTYSGVDTLIMNADVSTDAYGSSFLPFSKVQMRCWAKKSSFSFAVVCLLLSVHIRNDSVSHRQRRRQQPCLPVEKMPPFQSWAQHGCP